MSRFLMIRNLLAMAAADGSFTQGELELLSDRAARWGISDSEFVSAVEYAARPDVEIEVPAGADQRRELLQELLHVMAADGHLGEKEKQLFAVVASVMEIESDELDKIIDDALGELPEC